MPLSAVSVAPDDFDSQCARSAAPGSFDNPNQRVVLDTQFYKSSTLLSALGNNGLWISLDFDMTVGTAQSKVHAQEFIYKIQTLFGKKYTVSMCVVFSHTYILHVYVVG